MNKMNIVADFEAIVNMTVFAALVSSGYLLVCCIFYEVYVRSFGVSINTLKMIMKINIKHEEFGLHKSFFNLYAIIYYLT